MTVAWNESPYGPPLGVVLANEDPSDVDPSVRRTKETRGKNARKDRLRQQSEVLAHVVQAFVRAIDAKDAYTSGHSERVARLAVRIGLQMRFHPHQLHVLHLSGLLHDVGKIGIQDRVLRKSSRLTQAEFNHIKTHPQRGYEMLAELPALSELLPGVLHHHEQWDGEGYPLGLQGESIPVVARILAVADAMDAMSSDRPYRAGMPAQKVRAILRGGAGSQWDSAVIDASLAVIDDLEAICHRGRSQRSAV